MLDIGLSVLLCLVWKHRHSQATISASHSNAVGFGSLVNHMELTTPAVAAEKPLFSLISIGNPDP